MEPTNFAQSNRLFGPPKGESEDTVRTIFAASGTAQVGDKRCPAIVTAWKPTQAELEAMQRGEPMFLVILSSGMPPVVLHTDPFANGFFEAG